jgi:hypothetical protein
MQTTIINVQSVDAVIIGADGMEVMEELQQGERELLAKIDAALRAEARFAKACPGARLVRVDSNRWLGDRDECRFYLRYRHSGKGGMAEYWGHVGDVLKLDARRGIISVVQNG